MRPGGRGWNGPTARRTAGQRPCAAPGRSMCRGAARAGRCAVVRHRAGHCAVCGTGPVAVPLRGNGPKAAGARRGAGRRHRAPPGRMVPLPATGPDGARARPSPAGHTGANGPDRVLACRSAGRSKGTPQGRTLPCHGAEPVGRMARHEAGRSHRGQGTGWSDGTPQGRPVTRRSAGRCLGTPRRRSARLRGTWPAGHRSCRRAEACHGAGSGGRRKGAPEPGGGSGQAGAGPRHADPISHPAHRIGRRTVLGRRTVFGRRTVLGRRSISGGAPHRGWAVHGTHRGPPLHGTDRLGAIDGALRAPAVHSTHGGPALHGARRARGNQQRAPCAGVHGTHRAPALHGTHRRGAIDGTHRARGRSWRGARACVSPPSSRHRHTCGNSPSRAGPRRSSCRGSAGPSDRPRA